MIYPIKFRARVGRDLAAARQWYESLLDAKANGAYPLAVEHALAGSPMPVFARRAVC